MNRSPLQTVPSVESMLWSEYEWNEEDEPLQGMSLICPCCGSGRQIIFIDMIAKKYGADALCSEGEEFCLSVLSYQISKVSIHELVHWADGESEKTASTAEDLVEDYLLSDDRIFEKGPES